MHLFRSLAGSICQLLFFVAVQSTPLLDSVLLSNAAPLFIPLVVYNFGISTLLLIPIAMGIWRPLAARQWLLLLGVGAFYALTQYLIILAYRYASATELSPFNYTVVVFSGPLGWLVFGTVPSPLAVLGTVLICAGGILSIEAGHSDGGHWRFQWRRPDPRRHDGRDSMLASTELSPFQT